VTYLFNTVYVILIGLAFPLLWIKDMRSRKYRRGLQQRFTGQVPRRSGENPCIWLHAVSVGEVNLLRPLIEAIEMANSDIHCVISTSTEAGYRLATERYSPRLVFRCPLDFSWSVRETLRRIRPNVLILAELELWPNLIRLTHRSGAEVAVINGRLGDRSFRGYRRLRPWIGKLLSQLSLINCQDAATSARFLELGAPAERVFTTGSIKFDGAESDRNNQLTRELARLAGIMPEDVIFLAGSTQDPEEQMALNVYQLLKKDFPELRLILVPRHPERFDQVAQLLDRSRLCWQRRSRLSKSVEIPSWNILLVDTVGELGAWWGTSQIAYVGGSMGNRGGQNMIEPAAYGTVVCFGPQTKNFRDIVAALLKRKAATVIHDQRELADLVKKALSNPGFVEKTGNAARQLVAENSGATQRTLAGLRPLLERARSQANSARRVDTAHQTSSSKGPTVRQKI